MSSSPESNHLEEIIRRKINKSAESRAAVFMRQRKRARIAGAILSVISAGIYGYTIYAIKQEKLFDDLELEEVSSSSAAS